MNDCILIVRAKHGGYIVKKHDVVNNDTSILFAGTIDEVATFILNWSDGTYGNEGA